jgi:hypothetical protein
MPWLDPTVVAYLTNEKVEKLLQVHNVFLCKVLPVIAVGACFKGGLDRVDIYVIFAHA